MQFKTYVFFVTVFLSSCAEKPVELEADAVDISTPHVMVLGVAQDAGYPQAGCQKDCCRKYHEGHIAKRHVSCISIILPSAKKYWIVDATPDFPEQLKMLEDRYPGFELGGIFLTHAHIGHYTGLMHLGREAMGSQNIPVYAMPKMVNFLTENGPWSQLVALENIELIALTDDEGLRLDAGLNVVPTQVPHRDEYSETVGYYIQGNKQLLFIPDIDKWGKWDKDVLAEIQGVDYALLDGSFYKNGEIPGRDMSLIPHPFVEESMTLLDQLSNGNKSKVHFIHFNHTNPIIDNRSKAYTEVNQKGYRVAEENMVFDLN